MPLFPHIEFTFPRRITEKQKCAVYGWDASLALSEVLSTLDRIREKTYSKMTTEEEQQMYALSNVEDLIDVVENHPDCFLDSDNLISLARELHDDVYYKHYDQSRKIRDIAYDAWQKYKYPDTVK